MGSLHAADLVEGRILEREHASIRAGLSTIEGAIEDAHRLSSVELADRVARTTAWMHRTFLPHAAWEEAWLFARVDQETGSAWTTRGLRVQHEQLRELARALETTSTVAHERWTREIEFELIAALARLDGLLTAHMAEEEMFVLPLLEDRGDAAHPVGAPGG
jgi:iron-sulfur cluster repair protein YtfE (RIC family)